MLNDILPNEKNLLELISEGDESAFTKLFDFYKNRIYSIAVKITKSDIISEEIVQDVFLKIWLKRIQLNSIRNFSAYLFIITRNSAYKVLKSFARTYNITSIDEELKSAFPDDAADLLIEKERNALLIKAIERLPSQQQQVYHLIKDEGLTRNEVANHLGIQPETVKFHLAQAQKNIRAFCMLYLDIFIGFTALLFSLFGNI